MRVNFFAHTTEFALAFFEAAFHQDFGAIKFFGRKIAKTELLELHTDAPHIETICERRKNVDCFARDLFLFGGRFVLERLHVVEAIGEFDDDDAHVLTDSDE